MFSLSENSLRVGITHSCTNRTRCSFRLMNLGESAGLLDPHSIPHSLHAQKKRLLASRSLLPQKLGNGLCIKTSLESREGEREREREREAEREGKREREREGEGEDRINMRMRKRKRKQIDKEKERTEKRVTSIRRPINMPESCLSYPLTCSVKRPRR